MLVGKVRDLAAKRVEVEATEGLLGEEEMNGQNKVGEKDRRTRRRVQIEESLMEVCETMTDNMICKMESKSFIRGAYYLATQLLTRAYHQGVFSLGSPIWLSSICLRNIADKLYRRPRL